VVVVVVVVVDGREVSSSGKEDGEYKARMSEAGLSFETATRRTGLLAGLCRRVVDVDVVGKVDEAAEMRARTVLRFVRRVVVRVMVGRSRVVAAAVSGVEVILPFLFQRLQLICMLSYVRTGRIYDHGENCSGMYVVRVMVAVAIESGNFLRQCGSLVEISETMMLISNISACIVGTY
jgi:hypothetical protein